MSFKLLRATPGQSPQCLQLYLCSACSLHFLQEWLRSRDNNSIVLVKTQITEKESQEALVKRWVPQSKCCLCKISSLNMLSRAEAGMLNNLCRTASLANRNIGRIWKYLNQPSIERLVHVSVLSKLDYCNSVLYGLPAKQLSKLQRLQNSSAPLVTKAKRNDHITPVLRQLHWLPINQRTVLGFYLILSRHIFHLLLLGNRNSATPDTKKNKKKTPFRCG